MSVWFITGASRGFGLEIAKLALERGDSVVATARDPQRVTDALGAHEQLLAVGLDVTDSDAAIAAAASAVERFGRIDVLVNNAGRGLLGAVEEVTDEEARTLFDVNVFGLMAVSRAVLPHMREQRSGRVLNISSVAGQCPSAGWGVYASSKHAVEALSDAMGLELTPLGIGVTAIEPGVFRTDFLDESSVAISAGEIADYAGTVGQTRQWREDMNHAQRGDPVKAAEAMIAIVDADDPPERLLLGADCVERVSEKLAHKREEMDRWHELSVSTDHAESRRSGDVIRHGGM